MVSSPCGIQKGLNNSFRMLSFISVFVLLVKPSLLLATEVSLKLI